MKKAYQDPRDETQDRVRLDTLRVDDRFVAVDDGRQYVVIGWLKDDPGGCPKVRDVASGRETMFAGCAEGRRT